MYMLTIVKIYDTLYLKNSIVNAAARNRILPVAKDITHITAEEQ